MTTLNAQNAKALLSQFQNLNSESRTVSVVLSSTYMQYVTVPYCIRIESTDRWEFWHKWKSSHSHSHCHVHSSHSHSHFWHTCVSFPRTSLVWPSGVMVRPLGHFELCLRLKGSGFASRPLSSDNLRQVGHTCMPLSPISIIWSRSKGSDALRLER